MASSRITPMCEVYSLASWASHLLFLVREVSDTHYGKTTGSTSKRPTGPELCHIWRGPLLRSWSKVQRIPRQIRRNGSLAMRYARIDVGPGVSRPRNSTITMLGEKLHLSLDASLRTAEHLVSAMGRIFDVPPVARPSDLPIELDDYFKQDPDFTTSLDGLIYEYLVPYGATNPKPPTAPDKDKPLQRTKSEWNVILAYPPLSRRPNAEDQSSSNPRARVATKMMRLLKLKQRRNGAYATYS
ncbi:hypothetical protein BKA61DRAFT_568108 [Leptodontidium sp. MPI-SDFR-AT-0119]|nr:hypothetical protein BKA61DRAFT_568108 [Leptodontidium sp. MPI-SDFR-AT-0119]